MKKLITQIMKFGIVGFIATIIDFSVYYLLTYIVGINYVVASITSFIVSLIFNYILSIKWVFDVNKKQTIKDVILFVFLSTIGLLINTVVLWLSVELLHLNKMLAKLVPTVVVMIWNFVTRKIFIER